MAKPELLRRALDSYAVKHISKAICRNDCVLVRPSDSSYVARLEQIEADGNSTARMRYCKCEMPYNPDDLMIQCDGCSDWFHPICIDVNPEEAGRLDHFYCLDCSTENKKKLYNSCVSTRDTDVKVNTKRRRR